MRSKFSRNLDAILLAIVMWSVTIGLIVWWVRIMLRAMKGS